jgi:hypothetical protein
MIVRLVCKFKGLLPGIEPEDTERRWRALLRREHGFDLRSERAAQQRDITALQELAEALDDNTLRAQAWLRQMHYGLRYSDFFLACEAADMARACAGRAGSRTLEVDALAGKLHALINVGDQDTARQVQAKMLEKLTDAADDWIQAYALKGVVLYYHHLGDTSRALLYLQQSAQVAQRTGDRDLESRIDSNTGFMENALGLYPQARAILEDSRALAEAIGERSSQVSNLDNLSYT